MAEMCIAVIGLVILVSYLSELYWLGAVEQASRWLGNGFQINSDYIAGHIELCFLRFDIVWRQEL